MRYTVELPLFRKSPSTELASTRRGNIYAAANKQSIPLRFSNNVQWYFMSGR